MNPYLLMYNNHRSSAIISETKVTYCCDNKLECNTHLLLNGWIIIYGLLNSISNLTFKYPTNNTKLWINYPLIIFITDLTIIINPLPRRYFSQCTSSFTLSHEYSKISKFIINTLALPKKKRILLIWASPEHRALSNCWSLMTCSDKHRILVLPKERCCTPTCLLTFADGNWPMFWHVAFEIMNASLKTV